MILRNIAVIFVLLLYYQIFVYSQPKLEIEGGYSYDWGNVKSTLETVTAKIKLKNVGTDTLKIYKVKPNCGCTATDLRNAVLAPDSSVYMNIGLHITNYSGPVEKSIEINTSDPDARNIRYIIKANVIQPISFFPDKFIRFSTILAGEESIYKIVINNNTDEDVIIREIKKEPDYLQINLREETVIEAGKNFVLEAKINPSTLGNILVNIKFKTTCPDLPRVEIGGSAMVIDYSPKLKNQEIDSKNQQQRLELK